VCSYHADLLGEACNAVGKWFAEEEKKLAEVVYHLSGASPGDFCRSVVLSVIITSTCGGVGTGSGSGIGTDSGTGSGSGTGSSSGRLVVVEW